MMRRKTMKLMQDQFDDNGNLQPKTEGMTADVLAARKHFKRNYLRMEKWYGERFKAGVITYSLPDYIALQPDLSDAEKFLLADVDFFKDTEHGCYKENYALAVERGTTEGVIKNMISRLIKARFLTTARKDGRRILRVTIGEGESVNKKNRSPQCGHAGSPESDPKVTAMFPKDHRDVPHRSPESDQKITKRLGLEPAIIAGNHSQTHGHPSGDVRKTTTTTGPSTRLSSSFSPLVTGGLRPPGPLHQSNGQDSKGDDKSEGGNSPETKSKAVKLGVLVSKVGSELFPKGIIYEEKDGERFFQSRRKATVFSTFTKLVLAWERIGQTIENKDGSVYRYGACQETRKFSHFEKHYDRVLSDIDWENLNKRPRKLFENVSKAVEDIVFDRLGESDEGAEKTFEIIDWIQDQFKEELEAERAGVASTERENNVPDAGSAPIYDLVCYFETWNSRNWKKPSQEWVQRFYERLTSPLAQVGQEHGLHPKSVSKIVKRLKEFLDRAESAPGG